VVMRREDGAARFAFMVCEAMWCDAVRADDAAK
jgi:hypothetical protein